MRVVRIVTIIGIGVAASLLAEARPVAADALKCQRTISKESAKLLATVGRALGKCHDRVLKESLPPSTECRAETKTAFTIAKAESKVRVRIAKACGGDDRTCGTLDDIPLAALAWPGNCPDLTGTDCTGAIADCDDIGDCLACVDATAIDRTVGFAAPTSSSDERRRCQRSVLKEALRLFQTKTKALAKCWDSRHKDKHANVCPDPGDGKAALAIAKANAKFRTKLCKQCGGPDRACGGGDDLTPAVLELPTHCPAVAPCGGPIDDLDALVDCLVCLTDFDVDCATTLAVPAFAPYSPGCALPVPTPTPTATPTVTPTVTSTAPTATPTPGGDPCAATSPAGPVFWVATDGDDATGDGSSSDPWASIQHAVDTVPDTATILVRPGTYTGRQRLRQQFAIGVVVRSEIPYQARLRHDATVVTSFSGQGITLEGFDIAHDGPGASALVIQVQDTIAGSEATSRLIFRNNILHDSFNNDILKINNGATDVTVERNIFYNQTGSDEHIDINSVADVIVQDNIFFNDFAASGRANSNNTGSYIVIKDSNAGSDAFLGAERITVRRNVFLNWEGSTGSNFVLVGEDGQSFFEARDVLVENNLMLGNSMNRIRAPFGVKGARDVTFRHNTIVGDLPANAYAMRFNREGQNLPHENLAIYNNIWSDPTTTMADLTDTPIGDTLSFILDNNLYWNGGDPIPTDGNDLVNVTDDAGAIVGDPLLPSLVGLVTPVWDPVSETFDGGTTSTCAAFANLVSTFGHPGATGAAIDTARADQSPNHDILGTPRVTPDIGAVER